MRDVPGIHILRDTLVAMREKQTTVDSFCRIWREQSSLLETLPPPYRQVMEDVLSRLESGSQFAEESCSYRQEDLLTVLTDWLDKAQQALNKNPQIASV